MRGEIDIAIIGAGAAGLAAAIFARRTAIQTAPGARIVAFDGASKIGAKILISGGGRCNVTHDVVTPDDFNGNRNAIAKVLRTFTVAQTIEWFAAMGVMLKTEETGKLFPTTDRARTIVDALLRECEGVEVRTASRVMALDAPSLRMTNPSSAFGTLSPRGGEKGLDSHVPTETLLPGDGEKVPKADEGSWLLALADHSTIMARKVILATGGRSVPKTGSDGHGYAMVRAVGHTVTDVFPALVPLIVEEGHWTTSLSGTSLDAELSVRASSGRVLARQRGSLLFTHFGLSGPVALDISRHWIAARRDDVEAALVANFLPDETFESLEKSLLREKNPRATVASLLRGRIPERVLEALAQSPPLASLTKEARRRIIRALVEHTIPVVRDRGFDYAEVTAGGVPLSEIDVSTMASRKREGLYLCGEILDVDGRIGGYNFQWAWASGRLAGIHAARSLHSSAPE